MKSVMRSMELKQNIDEFFFRFPDRAHQLVFVSRLYVWRSGDDYSQMREKRCEKYKTLNATYVIGILLEIIFLKESKMHKIHCILYLYHSIEIFKHAHHVI